MGRSVSNNIMIYTTRQDFGKLFESVKEKGVGAEIGVQNGWNSLTILKYWTGKLLCVDIWENQDEFDTTVENISKLNTEIIKGKSVDVANTIEDESLDFVYIDAGHTYEDIKSDYEAWFPKVRNGGVISGHDYCDSFEGVKRFVDELGVKFNITTDDMWEGKPYQSWWFIK